VICKTRKISLFIKELTAPERLLNEISQTVVIADFNQ